MTKRALMINFGFEKSFGTIESQGTVSRLISCVIRDTGAGGGSHMSASLWRTLRRWGGLSDKLSRCGKGLLYAANPTDSGVPPMRVTGSTTIPIVFVPEDCVRPVRVRVVHSLPYGFILGASFLRANHSVLDFEPGRGFKPAPNSPWVPFLEGDRGKRKVTGGATRLCTFNPQEETEDSAEETLPPKLLNLPLPSPESTAFEDDMTLQWTVRLAPDPRKNEISGTRYQEGIKVPGFVSCSASGVVTGPLPQDKQLVMLLPVEKYDLEKEALVGIARGVRGYS